MRSGVRETAADALKRLAAEQTGPKRPRTINTVPEMLKLFLGGDPNPTQMRFITDTVPEQAAAGRIVRVKGYMGPLGCAKTSTLAAAVVMHALFRPGSRILVSRFTYGELETTTQERVLDVLRRLPEGIILEYTKTPPARLTLMPVIPSVREPSEIIFHSLDDPGKLRSVELTDAAIDEATEIDSKVVHEVETRCGRRGKGPFFLWMAFNPPATSHWLYKESVERKPPYVCLYRPQPRENAHNLPAGYYDSLASTLPEDLRRRLIDGDWGTDFSGQAVYPEFKIGDHVSDKLEYVAGDPVFRFWDFGYNNPACLVAQRSHRGHIKVLAEVDGKRVEIEPFVQQVRREMAALGVTEPQQQTGGMDYGDPAAYQHRDVGQTAAVLAKLGVYLVGRKSRIDDGLAVVRKALSTRIEGEWALRVHPRCTRLVQALGGGYRYKEVSEGQKPQLVPWKDDYYDHVCDALRYGMLNINLSQYREISRVTSVAPWQDVESYEPDLYL